MGVRKLPVLVIACAAFSCGSPTAPTKAIQFSTYTSTRFSFRHTGIDSANVAQIAAALEAEAPRITSDLDVSGMPVVTVTLYPGTEALRQAAASFAGPLPSFATGLVSGVDGIHIVSPNVAATWRYADGMQAMVHEFAHCVSLRANPGFANNPRWLWESVALYEAGQFTDPRTVAGAGSLTGFSTLNAFDNTMIYGVGASLARFVVDTRGKDAFRALIRTNGDLFQVLGISDTAFLNEWGAYLDSGTSVSWTRLSPFRYRAAAARIVAASSLRNRSPMVRMSSGFSPSSYLATSWPIQ